MQSYIYTNRNIYVYISERELEDMGRPFFLLTYNMEVVIPIVLHACIHIYIYLYMYSCRAQGVAIPCLVCMHMEWFWPFYSLCIHTRICTYIGGDGHPNPYLYRCAYINIEWRRWSSHSVDMYVCLDMYTHICFKCRWSSPFFDTCM